MSEPRRARFRTRALETQTEEELDENFKPNELGIKDIISLWITQILQTYGDEESKDGAPVCEGSVDDLVGGPIFLALYPYFLKYGGVFKLAFGPKVFMVLSDPVIVREVLKEKPFAFSKGVLAEILEPIMGQGLIRALRGVEEPAQAARAGVPQGVAGPHGGSVRGLLGGAHEEPRQRDRRRRGRRGSTWRSVSVPCRWTSSV